MNHSWPTAKRSCFGLRMTTAIVSYEIIGSRYCLDQDKVVAGADRDHPYPEKFSSGVRTSVIVMILSRLRE